RSTGTALKQCAAYYEEGYKIAVDCDLKQCFDMLNHDKLMYLFERHVQDKSISTFIRRSLQVGAIDLSGEVAERKIGAPQGGVISPLLCNIYLHELDKELEKRGHRFVRYADDFVIFVRTKRAGERVMSSVTKFIE
ncbi:group II intron reverse transcriptase/maturase, partial [Staphylococcus pseudintermedius]|nr:group II intron reverse transcriptase/maturase [Staphylococcus pseudintermedius]